MALDPETPNDRQEIRVLLAENIQALDERVQRKRDGEVAPEEEQLQLKRLRTLAQLARQYRLLARDADVDEMETQLELLRTVVDEDNE